MDVLGALRDAASEVFAGEPVAFAYLFGSHARGDARPDSDVDVAVHLTDDAEAQDYLRLALRYGAELAHRAEVGPIDGVVVLNEAPLRLVGRVLAEGRVIHSADDVARVRFEVRMRARALDFEPRAAALDRALLRHMASGGTLMVDPVRLRPGRAPRRRGR
jgi:predicted nucleotidyltransferase